MLGAQDERETMHFDGVRLVQASILLGVLIGLGLALIFYAA